MKKSKRVFMKINAQEKTALQPSKISFSKVKSKSEEELE
jgi:hypothetical protein